jgi:hypothetical protein
MATEWYLVQVIGVAGGQQMMNTFRFRGDNVTASDTLAMSEQLLDDFINDIVDLLLDLLPDEYFILKLIAKRFAPVGTAAAKRVFQVGDLPGTLGTTVAPGQICPAVRLIPAMGGSVVGRIFLPTIGASQIPNNQFLAGYITALDALMGALTAPFGSAAPQWRLCINQATTPGSPVNVLGWNLSPRVGFQRRRVIPL